MGCSLNEGPGQSLEGQVISSAYQDHSWGRHGGKSRKGARGHEGDHLGGFATFQGREDEGLSEAMAVRTPSPRGSTGPPNPPVHRQVSITCLLIGVLEPQPPLPSNQSPTLCSVFLFTLAQVALGCRLKHHRCLRRQRMKPIQGSVSWLWHMCALPTGAFAFLRAFWSSILQFLKYLVSLLAVVS